MGNIYEEHKHHVINMVFVVVFIVFFGIGMYLLSQRGTGVNNQKTGGVQNMTDEESSEKNSDKPMLRIAHTGKSTYNVGDEITFTITGDSKGVDVNGFDALIGYDPMKLEFVSAESASKNFQLFTFKNPTYLSLTATKLLTVNAPSIFNGDVLVTIKMKAKASGKLSAELMPMQGHEKTKMVDNKAHIMIPVLNSVEVEVK